MGMGHAAGVAAAQCVATGRAPADLDVRALREELRLQKAILEVDA